MRDKSAELIAVRDKFGAKTKGTKRAKNKVALSKSPLKKQLHLYEVNPIIDTSFTNRLNLLPQQSVVQLAVQLNLSTGHRGDNSFALFCSFALAHHQLFESLATKTYGSVPM